MKRGLVERIENIGEKLQEIKSERDVARFALAELRRQYFVAGGEMTSIEACELIDKALGWRYGRPTEEKE